MFDDAENACTDWGVLTTFVRIVITFRTVCRGPCNSNLAPIGEGVPLRGTASRGPGCAGRTAYSPATL